MALKHNKKKNSRIIYEQLMILASNLAKNKNIKEANFVLNFVKSNFSPKTQLGKEKKLFDAVIKSKVQTQQEASLVLEEVMTESKMIDQRALDWEKVDLINKIVKNFGKDLFSIPVKEYKLLASTQILFNESRNEFKYSEPTERVKIKSMILENLTRKKEEEFEDYEKHEMDNFTFNILVNKFNKKYSSLMNEDQKEILSKWVDYLLTEDSKEFSNFLSGKVDKIKAEINLSFIKEEHLNSDYLELLKEAKEEVSDISQNINEDNVYKVMKYFDLIDELKEIETSGPDSLEIF